jgi:hypothetical protein
MEPVKTEPQTRGDRENIFTLNDSAATDTKETDFEILQC